jgi:hypothetical protein
VSDASGDFMNRLVSKAAWLIHEGRIVRISDVLYYVVGRKNRHLVRVEGGKLSCTCNGYRERGICSHTIAVSTIMRLTSGREYLGETLRMRVERELKLLRKQSHRA